MIALYARVSTQEQAVKGFSIDEQVERMKNFCNSKEWKSFQIYKDAGFSGASTDRPALQKMIRDIKKGLINVVLVYKLDRLSRSQKETLTLIDDIFLANNCDFISLNENFDTSSPLGRAMIGILAVFAQLEREQIKERIEMGKDARAKKGLITNPSRIPTGYSFINGQLVVNEFEKMQIVQIFNDYLSGMTPRQIADKLNKAGMLRKGSEWMPASVRYILESKTYLGYIRFNNKWFKADHESIIDEATFEKAQRLKMKRSMDYKHDQRGHRITSYLGGLMVCDKCGMKYSKISRNYKDKKYFYYACDSRAEKVCGNKRWKMQSLDNLIFEEIKKLAINPLPTPEPTHANQDKLTVLSSKIGDIDKQLGNLIDLYTVDTLPMEILQAKIRKLNSQRMNLEKEYDRIEEENRHNLSKGDVETLVASFDAVLNKGSFDEIRAILNELIEKIVIDGKNITIHWSFM